MEPVESAFEALFDLVQNQGKCADNDVKRICNNASKAYASVFEKINIGDSKQITVIDNIIKNVRDKQLQSAKAKLDNAKHVYKLYIEKFIVEEKRKEQQKDKAGASRNQETSRQKGGRRIDRFDGNREEWKRHDVVELYEQLYQKDWKSAYEEYMAKGTLNENEVCETLYDIFRRRYNVSREMVEETIKTMKTSVEKVVNPHREEVLKDMPPPKKEDDSICFLKIFLRRNFEQMNARITKKTEEVYTKWQSYPKTLEYINKCTMITSLMMVQDPPMSISYLDVNNPIPADTYVDHENTRGSRVAYRVFPALLAKTNGRVLVKGVIGRK